MSTQIENCECLKWCRGYSAIFFANHHQDCPKYNDSLIDVWRIQFGGSFYITDKEGDIQDEERSDPEYAITKEKMHREQYEQLPEFQGF